MKCSICRKAYEINELVLRKIYNVFGKDARILQRAQKREKKPDEKESEVKKLVRRGGKKILKNIWAQLADGEPQALLRYLTAHECPCFEGIWETSTKLEEEMERRTRKALRRANHDLQSQNEKLVQADKGALYKTFFLLPNLFRPYEDQANSIRCVLPSVSAAFRFYHRRHKSQFRLLYQIGVALLHNDHHHTSVAIQLYEVHVHNLLAAGTTQDHLSLRSLDNISESDTLPFPAIECKPKLVHLAPGTKVIESKYYALHGTSEESTFDAFYVKGEEVYIFKIQRKITRTIQTAALDTLYEMLVAVGMPADKQWGFIFVFVLPEARDVGGRREVECNAQQSFPWHHRLRQYACKISDSCIWRNM